MQPIGVDWPLWDARLEAVRNKIYLPLLRGQFNINHYSYRLKSTSRLVPKVPAGVQLEEDTGLQEIRYTIWPIHQKSKAYTNGSPSINSQHT